jgi:hypothetical protein
MKFMKMLPGPRQTGSISLIAVAVFLLCQVCFGYNIKFLSYSYSKNLTYGETFDIAVTVENDGFDIGWVYFSPALVHTETGVEKYPLASSVKRRFYHGETAVLSTQGWLKHDRFTPPPAGEYRVVLILYGENDKEIARLYGDDPIFINFSQQARETKHEDTDKQNT